MGVAGCAAGVVRGEGREESSPTLRVEMTCCSEMSGRNNQVGMRDLIDCYGRLLYMVRYGSRQTRAMAALSLLVTQDPEALEAVIEFLRDHESLFVCLHGDKDIVSGSRYLEEVLQKVDIPDITEELFRLLEEPDAATRIFAARSLKYSYPERQRDLTR